MNESPPPISALLEHLSSLLPPSYPSSRTYPSVSTSTDDFLPIIPRSIPPLPLPNLSPLTFPTTLPNPSPSISSSLLPTNPLPLPTLATYLSTSILPYLSQSALSPRYYGFVTGGTTPAALLADWVVSVYDQNLSVHAPAESIATVVEQAALGGLRELFYLSDESWGSGGSCGAGAVFTTGATASNILGLAMGREYTLNKALSRLNNQGQTHNMSVSSDGLVEVMAAAGITKIQVLTTLPHSSIGKACSVLGIGRKNVLSVLREGTEVDVDLSKVREFAGREGTVSLLVISAGEVNTGHFTNLGLKGWKALRELADELGVWVHVDGAFGLFGRVLMGEAAAGHHQQQNDQYEEIIRGVQGLDLADSITGDSHKLLNVPYDCGFFFTRHRVLSETVFSNGNPAYLKSSATDGVPSPMNIGIENSRRFRALPVHATLLAYGREGYVDMLKRQIGLARRVVGWLVRDARYEVLPKYETNEEVERKTFMIVLFRAREEGLNGELVKRINETGKIYVTGTVWEGKAAARIAVSNWQVDVERDGKIIEEVLNEVAQ